MISRNVQKVESRSGIFLILFLGFLVLVLFFFLWIRPLTAMSERLDRREMELKLHYEKQQRLAPVYQRLANREFPAALESLEVPERGPLPEVEIASIIPYFRMMARDSGLVMQSVNPQLATLETTPEFLAVDVEMAGNYLAFRDFIFALAKLPYLGGIEKISVQQVGKGADDKEISMKLWLIIG
ncbi:MAG: hypothetical protein AVO39_01765 [delta proteobacterium MLS_D]|nr:MAG: hypothetical protein AVO39_01765 [delta proteobacterium MLS_D]